MNRLFLAVLLLLSGAAASARPARDAKARGDGADDSYQTGTQEYARGRYAQALAAFQEALRRDPRSRVARIAVNRVREEMAMTAREAPSRVPGRAAQRKFIPPEDETFLSRAAEFFSFERTIGDERDRQGRLAAMRGRIAQLLVERKICLSRRRAFSKNAELHALSRRLA